MILNNATILYRFIGEESAAVGKRAPFTDSPTWIIDPIDGTTNFVHRIPFIAICVGLTIKKQLRAGIVFNPITDELWSAQVQQLNFKDNDPTFRPEEVHSRTAFQSESQKQKVCPDCLSLSRSVCLALNKSVICTSLGIHNIVEKGESWLDLALGNQRKTILSGVRGFVSLTRTGGRLSINISCHPELARTSL